jgi:DNA replication ATP-dependent helicase Dna2
VAITRAKHKLLIIGDMSCLQRYQPFQRLFDCLSPEQIIVLSDGKRDFEWEQLVMNMKCTDDVSLL